MEEGVLCLKWRDHRSTFLRMLSSTRKKGAFCDATLVCEGKFYPVHQLVLSTCSDYFQQMFEAVSGRAHTTPLLVVLAGVTQRDLEALLEYMYAGEATILQGELATFMKAAEGLKIRGLAEPSPAEEPESPRRPQDTWAGKRKREDGGRRIMLTDIVSPAQLATVELAPEAQSERDMATGTPGDLPGAVAPLSPPLIFPQVKYEDVLVKDEPQHQQEEEEWRPQGKRQKATTLGEGTDAEQILGFCDPGLTYLAHSSGLGALADPGHASHHPNTIHQRRMGRPTSEIWHHYIIERAAGKTAVYCRYCSQKYGYPNATKMKIHTMKCSKCPEEVKRQFEGTRPDVVEGPDGTLRLGLDLGGDAQYQPHHHMERTEHIENTLPKAVTDNPSLSIKTLSYSEKNPPQDAPTKTDSPTKPKRHFPSPEKSKGSSSSPEKAQSSEVLLSKDQQPSKSSKPDDRVSLRSERVYHHPAF